MAEDLNKLREYKNDFFQPYNFTIKSDEYYIYRYFKNFERLEQFLKFGIYMSCADSFEDGLECIDKELIQKITELHNSEELWPESNLHITVDDLNEIKEKSRRTLKKISSNVKKIQKEYLVSCWYLPDKQHENDLMWRSNSVSNDFGYVVRIKLEDFLDNLSRSVLLQEIKVIYGIVQYFNFKKNDNVRAIKYKAFRKHNSYSDERELRLVIKNGSSTEAKYIKLAQRFYDDTSIFMSPRASYDQYLKKRAEIMDKYEIDIHQSELSIAYNLKKLSNQV